MSKVFKIFTAYIFDAVEVWRDNHSEEQSRGNPDHQ